MSTLRGVYLAQLRISLAEQFQYRGAILIWLLGLVIQPVIYLTIWSTVAESSGDDVDGYTARNFAAYFIVAMLVNHATHTSIMWEFESRVRHGSLSALLLRPIHPIHRDIATGLAFKGLTMLVALPVAGLLALAFHPVVTTPFWAVLVFIPALVLAMALRFTVEWTLAMAAFWTTSVTAINRLYFAVFIFSGYVAPIDLLPEPAKTIAEVLPFRWMLAFPVELAIGRVSATEALIGITAQAAWLAAAVIALTAVWNRGIRRYSAVGA
ncbi:MAG: ABC-2 family transporter protein [Chloroflexota bacterium]|nr:ABC-2 family transporter protein [Chloroflexota bacterium]